MDEWLYVMQIERGKSYNRVTKAVVTRHVEHIRSLDDDGKLALCGAFKGYPGVAGMVPVRHLRSVKLIRCIALGNKRL